MNSKRFAYCKECLGKDPTASVYQMLLTECKTYQEKRALKEMYLALQLKKATG